MLKSVWRIGLAVVLVVGVLGPDRPGGGPVLNAGGSSSGWWGLVAWWGSWSLWEEFLRVVVPCCSVVR